MEEKETIHINLLTELTGNLISEESEWEEDWSESDEYGMPLDETELADYEEAPKRTECTKEKGGCQKHGDCI